MSSISAWCTAIFVSFVGYIHCAKQQNDNNRYVMWRTVLTASEVAVHEIMVHTYVRLSFAMSLRVCSVKSTPGIALSRYGFEYEV